MRPIPSIALLALLALLTAIPPAASEDDPDAVTRRLVAVVRRDRDREAWHEAVRALRAGGTDAAEMLDRTLRNLLEAKRKRRDRAADAIRGLAKRFGDGRPSPKKIEAWDEARRRATEWLFDLRTFPDIDGPIYGPQEGYAEAMERARKAIRSHAALRSRLDRAIGSLPPRDSAERLRADLREATGDVERVAREISGSLAEGEDSKNGDDGAPRIPALSLLLLDLALGDHAGAARRYRTLAPGWERFCAFEAYGRSLLTAGHRSTRGGSGSARALEGLNRYRMALGYSPLVRDERLARMATDHSREMARHGYLSHESPIPENRTKEKRAAKVDYPGSVAECISARTDPETAVEVWKWDGGHHRTMIGPRYVHAGLGAAGPCVLDVGSGDAKSPPAIRYQAR